CPSGSLFFRNQYDALTLDILRPSRPRRAGSFFRELLAAAPAALSSRPLLSRRINLTRNLRPWPIGRRWVKRGYGSRNYPSPSYDWVLKAWRVFARWFCENSKRHLYRQLLVSQRNQRINTRCPARGNVTCGERHQ